MLHIYYGLGKGKTTAAMGLALRAIGAGLRVLIVQFLKGQESNEEKALRSFNEMVHFFRFGKTKFVKIPDAEDIGLAKKAMNKCYEEIKVFKPQIMVLDEILDALDFKLISLEDILSLLDGIDKETEVILTGHNIISELIDRADLITEMKCIRHYYNKGIKARKGIEY